MTDGSQAERCLDVWSVHAAARIHPHPCSQVAA